MNMKDTLTGPTTVERSEGEAIARARRGDAGAFEYLYKAHCRHVYSLCLRMIRNPAEAEDLTQQTFLQVFRKIGTFRGESGFSTWLHRVTVNIVLMRLRRRKRTEALLEDLDHPGSDNEAPRQFGASDTSMFGAIDRLNLKRAIRKLPSGYKRFFLLYDVLGYEHHRSRDSWAVRRVVQNRSFTRPANDCVDYCKENRGEQKSMSPPRRPGILQFNFGLGIFGFQVRHAPGPNSRMFFGS